MLVDFTISNYRSIRDPVTLSAIAQERGAARAGRSAASRLRTDDEIAAPLQVEGRRFTLLPALGIFGANASGKTNVLRALDLLLDTMFKGSSGFRGFSELSTPFGLDPRMAEQPSTFTIRVALEATLYEYDLAVREGAIVRECLRYTPAEKRLPQLVFERIPDAASERSRYRTGRAIKGPAVHLGNAVVPHELFVPFLFRLRLPAIAPLAEWIGTRPPGDAARNEDVERYLALKAGFEVPKLLDLVTVLIRGFDTGLTGIEVRRTRDASEPDDLSAFRATAIHNTEHGPVRWPIHEESAGTQRLFHLAFRMYMALSTATPMLVDELDSHIHPLITRRIVEMFQSERTNPRRAQLIFTSHDSTLLQGQLLRRDQVWFTQKRSDGSTDLYSASDFRARNDLALGRAYLDGRFGAVPVLPSEPEALAAESAR